MAADKVALRARMRAQRQAVQPHEARAAAREVAARIANLDSFQKASCVALFSPFRCEIDPTPVVEFRSAEGKVFCLPCSARAKVQLGFRQVDTPPGVTAVTLRAQLTEGEYGILEPTGPRIPLARLDLIVVPALAFDRAGYRLGWGAGYYDRLLSRCRAGTQTVVVGYDWQCVDHLPKDPHDEAVHWVITPSETRAVD